ncbi:MAG: transcription-repair coupling factor, partial [Microbacteriaceae bacterium]|nr:transcription-repair coupling factor [Microbacteriaceae bacterium]
MSLRFIPSWLTEDDAVAQALDATSEGGQLVVPAGAYAPVVASSAAQRGAGSVTVVVCATGRESDSLRDQLRSLVEEGTEVLDFPAWETLPHERLSPHPETTARRRSALRALWQAGRNPRRNSLIVVASIRALVQRINPEIARFTPWIALEGSSEHSLGEWVSYLLEAAYQRVDLVTRRGEFALRGGILDVFPP